MKTTQWRWEDDVQQLDIKLLKLVGMDGSKCDSEMWQQESCLWPTFNNDLCWPRLWSFQNDDQVIWFHPTSTFAPDRKTNNLHGRRSYLPGTCLSINRYNCRICGQGTGFGFKVFWFAVCRPFVIRVVLTRLTWCHSQHVKLDSLVMTLCLPL